MELELIKIAVLIITGLFAGAINVLAGGGSNLTVPALIIMGMPAEVANATNRVGVFMQCLVGVIGFKKHDKMASDDTLPILMPTIIGGFIGAMTASFAPTWIIKPLLLGTMLTMSFIILIAPATVIPNEGEKAFKVAEKPLGWWGLLLAGVYGGFVQAGVGFVLIAALAGILRYDIVRTQGLKLLCSLIFTLVALIIFIARSQIDWIPALILMLGYIVGAHYAVKFAIKAKKDTLKWFLFIMTLVGSTAAMFF